MSHFESARPACLRGPLTLALLIASACSGQSASGDLASTGDGAVAFTNVNVLPMDTERVVRGQTVVVRDGVIVQVGPLDAVEVPSGARRIDGADRYLLPGLADLHIHLRSIDELASYLAHGVTTVLHMSGAMGGAPDLLRYRDEIARGTRPGPALYTTGPILDGSPPVFAGVSIVVTTPAEARRTVAAQHEAGYDFIKVYNNLTPELLGAAVEAAHERGMAVLGHIPRKAGREQALQQALGAGLDVIAHGEEYFFTYFYAGVDSLLDRGEVPYPMEARIPGAVEMTREAGAAVIPNLSFPAMTRRQLDDLDGVQADAEARYLHPDVRAMWEAQNPTGRPDLERFDRREQAKYAFLRRLTKSLNDAGVPLLLGTDASAPGMYPGASAHLELRELVAAGLTPYEALLTGTRNAGAFIERSARGAEPFGTVAPGQRADLLLVRGNPLQDIAAVSDIDGVMVRGRWLTRDEIERMRRRGVEAPS